MHVGASVVATGTCFCLIASSPQFFVCNFFFCPTASSPQFFYMLFFYPASSPSYKPFSTTIFLSDRVLTKIFFMQLFLSLFFWMRPHLFLQRFFLSNHNFSFYPSLFFCPEASSPQLFDMHFFYPASSPSNKPFSTTIIFFV